MADVFVSYAAEDRDRIVPLVERLTSMGWSVWWDRELVAGPSFEQKIEQAIDAAGCVVVAWSKHSIHSHWCRAEAAEGLDRGILVPLRLDDVRVPLSFRGSHSASLLGWPKKAGEVDLVLAGVRQCLGESSDPEAATGAAAPPRPRRKWATAAAAGLVLAAAGLIALLWSSGVNVGDVLAGGTAPETMAVLPFENLSADESLTAVGLGLAEEVLADLARWPTPAVASRTSAFRLAESGADVTAIAAALRVSYVLEGSLRPVGDEVRITAQLTRAKDGLRVWLDDYERPRDILAAGAAPVAGQIAHASRIWVLRDAEKALHRSFDPDPEAMALMDLGYDQYTLLANGHGGNWRLITDYYRRAVELDPSFWYAAQLLGNAYFRRAGKDLPVAEARRRAGEALDLCEAAARESSYWLGPLFCELQRAQLAFFVDLDYAAAQAKAEALLRQVPGAHSVHWLLAMTYLAEGERPRARASLAIADQVDHGVDQMGFLMVAALATRWLGDFRDSREYARRVLEIVDNDRLRSVVLRWLAAVEAELGNTEAAAGHAEAAWRLTGDVEPLQFTDLFERIGERDRAAYAYRRAARPATALTREHYADWWSEGEVKAHLAMGEFAAAAESMKRYIGRRDLGVIMMIRSDRALQPHRTAPWFSEVIDALEAAEAAAAEAAPAV